MSKRILPVGATLWYSDGSGYRGLRFGEHVIVDIEKRSYILLPKGFLDDPRFRCKAGFAQVDKLHGAWFTDAGKHAYQWRHDHKLEVTRAVTMCDHYDKLVRIAAILELPCASIEQPDPAAGPDREGR